MPATCCQLDVYHVASELTKRISTARRGLWVSQCEPSGHLSPDREQKCGIRLNSAHSFKKKHGDDRKWFGRPVYKLYESPSWLWGCSQSFLDYNSRAFSRCFCPTVSILKGRLRCALSISSFRCLRFQRFHKFRRAFPIYVSIYPSIHRSTHPPPQQASQPATHPSIHPSIHPSLYISIYLYISLYIYIYIYL